MPAIRSISFGVFLLLALALLTPAHAADSPAHGSTATAADKAAVRNFKLTTDYLKKYEAFSDEAAIKPCKLSLFILYEKKSKAKTIDQMATAYDAQPAVHAALARHNLTARDYLLGKVVLANAALGEMQQKMAKDHPKMAGQMKPSFKVSSANLAFYGRHEAEIRSANRQRGREMMKRNGGKMPACMRNT